MVVAMSLKALFQQMPGNRFGTVNDDNWGLKPHYALQQISHI